MAETVGLPLDELRALLGEDAVRIGEGAGVSQIGTLPRVALLPPDRERLGDALALLDGRGLTVLPIGGGTAVGPLDPAPDLLILTSALDRLVDYQPEDMTITAEAGMTLAALQTILAERGQVLPLDPALPERATVGGVVAANRTGPWRAAYRTPRDWVIGLTVIAPDGRSVRGGGRVVKNVAGYDLPRLYTGSRGTLGVIAEVSFKVMPRPPHAALCVVSLPDARAAEAALARVMDSDLMPTCLELLNARAASRLPGTGRDAATAAYQLIVGFEGVTAAVTWQRETLANLVSDAGVRAVPDAGRAALLETLRAFPAEPGWLQAQVNLLSSDLAPMADWCEAEAAARGMEVSLAAHAANGVLRLRLQSDAPDAARAASFVDAARDAAGARGGSLVVTAGEPGVLAHVDRWGPPGPASRLMRGIKAGLDPSGTMYARTLPWHDGEA
jgi:glycolate oxidase FAD binding subunit